jgi:DNA repair protein RadC
MSITDWPEGERPREKLLARGAGALSDAELLAIFLRTGVRGQSAVDVARALLGRHGGLAGLMDAPVARLVETPGLGPAKAAQLAAALEIGRRYLRAGLAERAALTSPQAVRDYLALELRGLPREVFACLFLDSQHRVLAFEVLFQGTLDSTSVHPREVVKAALRHNAAAVILAHNHPSGVAEPSAADRHITQRLKESLALVEVRLLDHFIIGGGTPLSFAERGLL